MKKYTPNFNDPRVQLRINRSIDYALANLSKNKPTQWSTRQIDNWFGSSHNKLSALIRSEFLICVDPYYNPEKGIAKKYLLNVDGLAKLAAKINRNIIPCAVHLKREKLNSADNLYAKQIESGDFQYKLKSNRLWNDIQNLDNATRKPLFTNYGYIYEYDIVSSAPNILTQYARSLGLEKNIDTIDDYLKDTAYYRNRLAKLLSCDLSTAKQLITSRFAGARFGSRNSIFNQLNGNWIQYNRLKNDAWYLALTKDIKTLWDSIKIARGVNRLNARDKWDIYFSQELRVMRSVHRYMDKYSMRYFHEHDGWRCDQAIDVRKLKLHIERTSGYWLEFDEEIYR